MTTMRKGEERGSKTAGTSFIKGTSVNIVALISAREKLYLKYPDRKPTKLRVERKEEFLQFPMIMARELQVNMKFSKQMVPFKSFLDRFNKILGPKRQELIAQKDNNIEELQKSIQEDEQIADYENEDQTIRERERERITEKRQQIDALENEREKNLKKALHRERMRNTFKKYGFTVTAWQLEQQSE